MTRPLKQNGIGAEHAARAVGCHELAIGKAEQLYVYKCKWCRGWHLTRQVQPPYYAADYYEQGK